MLLIYSWVPAPIHGLVLRSNVGTRIRFIKPRVRGGHECEGRTGVIS
jgi:hypothetical protein